MFDDNLGSENPIDNLQSIINEARKRSRSQIESSFNTALKKRKGSALNKIAKLLEESQAIEKRQEDDLLASLQMLTKEQDAMLVKFKDQIKSAAHRVKEAAANIQRHRKALIAACRNVEELQNKDHVLLKKLEETVIPRQKQDFEAEIAASNKKQIDAKALYARKMIQSISLSLAQVK